MFKFGLPTLDKLTKGLKTGQLVIVLGAEGTGKTALSRTICEANFKEYSEEYILQLDYPFSTEKLYDTDVLIMGEKANLVSDGEITLPSHTENWQRLSMLSKDLRMSAYDRDEAVIWTFQTNRRRTPTDESSENLLAEVEDDLSGASFSMLRPADFIICCRKNKVFLAKNRYGQQCIEINVSFVPNLNNQTVMREI